MTGRPEHLPTIKFEKVAGYTLRTAIWKGGAERPILFFNGIGANLELIAPLASAFKDRDVITFDMPGIGESPVPTLPYRSWQMARAASKILDRNGYGVVDVMGVSWGGAMAQQFAFQCGKRVGKLILAATSAGMIMVPGKPSALAKLGSPRRYIDSEYMMKNFESLYGDEADVADGYSLGLRAPSLRGYFYQMLAMAGWTSVPFLPFLKQRTLVMMGDRDQIVPVANGRLLAGLIPEARLYIVKDGGHLFLVSKIDETMTVLEDFLAETDRLSVRRQAA